jgi:hypothetical protein
MRAVAAWHAGDDALDDAGVIAEFRGELARIRAQEEGKSSEEILDAATTARTKGDSMPIRFLRRTRHWTDGAIIGSKSFVQEVGCMFEEPRNHARILKKQLSRGLISDGGVLHCFKRLREQS